MVNIGACTGSYVTGAAIIITGMPQTQRMADFVHIGLERIAVDAGAAVAGKVNPVIGDHHLGADNLCAAGGRGIIGR